MFILNLQQSRIKALSQCLQASEARKRCATVVCHGQVLQKTEAYKLIEPVAIEIGENSMSIVHGVGRVFNTGRNKDSAWNRFTFVLMYVGNERAATRQ